MKKLLSFSLLVLFTGILTAQTVENIQVEQDGEKLNINYRIGGSTSEQLYFVTLTCSIDGGVVFEPKSVIGDVGSNIRGGKSYNTIVWNVFNDVDEVGNVEFFVKVDLTKDESVVKKTKDESGAVKNAMSEIIPKSTKGKKKFDRNIYAIYSASAGGYWIDFDFWEKMRPLGIKAGYLGNWGGYGAVRYGWDWEPGGYDEPGYSAVAGVSKYILGNDNYRLHGYAGLGIDNIDMQIECGFTGVVAKRIVVDLGIAVVPYYFSASIFGIGVIF